MCLKMTVLSVQTDRIIHNMKIIEKACGKGSIIPDLSANAFGLGDIAVASLLKDNGYTAFSVSKLEEAERIAENVDGVQIFLMTPYTSESETERIVRADIIATVTSNENAVMLSGIAKKYNKKAMVQLRFDTGAGSTGFLPEEAKSVAATVRYLDNLSVCGTYTKFRTGISEKKAHLQLERFTSILQALSREGVDYGMAHISSAEQALRMPWTRLDCVRVGQELCGRLSGKDKWGFKKVGRLVTDICDIRWISKGHTTGENGSIRVRKSIKIATVPVGYADGLITVSKKGIVIFGGKNAYCEIGGKKAQIIGKPGFHNTMIDVTDLDCKPGDIVSIDVSTVYVTQRVRREYV